MHILYIQIFRERERENLRREKMERRLSEATMKGSVESLINLIQEDPLILDKAIASCISQSPLHLSSLLGHLDFTTELLTRNPEFAAELDSEGCSPLHLAAAKGHLEIVKQLLLAGPEMGLVWNSDGRTPLHVAAIKGRVEVVAELVRVVPESTLVVTDRGETGLHLCVRHNRLEALKFLVEVMRRERELVNRRDCEGNTILHIAVAKKQIEIIKFLLNTGAVEVNPLNRNGSTCLDILKQSPRDLRDSEIDDALRHAGGLTSKDLHLIKDEWVPPKVPQIAKRLSSHQKSSKKPIPKHKHTDWLASKRSALMVVASLIATVAFQAGLTPPGGVWQDDYKVDSNGKPVAEPHTVGTAVMAYKDPLQYGVFMIFNTIAFLASLSVILLLVSGLPLKRRRWMWFQMVIMWVSITALVMTYFLSLRNMSPKTNSAKFMLRKVTEISILTWLTLMAVVFIGNIVRMNLWILRKYGYIKEKERTQEEIDDERREEEEEEEEEG